MKQVAKLVIIDPDDKYLLMYRCDHPTFGVDPDLPGGTVELGETMIETTLREVQEEAGVIVSSEDVRKVYSGTDYSTNGTCFTLFVIKLQSHPDIQISWEHSSYEWLSLSEFLKKSKKAKDTYMHMVYEVMRLSVP